MKNLLQIFLLFFGCLASFKTFATVDYLCVNHMTKQLYWADTDRPTGFIGWTTIPDGKYQEYEKEYLERGFEYTKNPFLIEEVIFVLITIIIIAYLIMRRNKNVIRIHKSFELFTDTLSYLDKRNLEETDEELKSLIFEELPGDSFSFLHEKTINRLIKARKIPLSIKTDIDKLRGLVLKQLDNTKSIQEYRESLEWKYIRDLSEKIQEKIK